MKFKKGFFMIPNYVFDLGLSPYEIAVLTYLQRLAPNPYPSITTISARCRVSVSKVKTTLKSLAEKELINWESGNSKASNTYKVKLSFDRRVEAQPSKSICEPTVEAGPDESGHFADLFPKTNRNGDQNE
jgi:DNA-binding IclR family transcriptional regulator